MTLTLKLLALYRLTHDRVILEYIYQFKKIKYVVFFNNDKFHGKRCEIICVENIPEILKIVKEKYRFCHLACQATRLYISNQENLVFESFKYSPLRFVRKNMLESDFGETIKVFWSKYESENNFLLFIDKENNRFETYLKFFKNDNLIIDLTPDAKIIRIGIFRQNRHFITNIYKKTY